MARDHAPGWTDVILPSIRSVRSRPAFGILVFGTLALSLGANLAVFTIVNSLWLRPRPVADPDRVVMLLGREEGTGSYEGTYWDQHHLDQVRTIPGFESVAGQVPTTGEVLGNRLFVSLPEKGYVETLAVTHGYFATLGVRITGQDFRLDDDRAGAPLVGIISDALWRSSFQASTSVLGSIVGASPQPIRIIGIAPPGFHGARLGERIDVWVTRYAVSRLALAEMGQRDPVLLGLARIRRGISLDEAERLLNERVHLTAPVRVMAIGRLYGSPQGSTIAVSHQGLIWLATVMSGLVLLSGCSTLTALVLVHFERRRGELAIRLALGSPRGAIFGGLAAELGLLMILGTLGALATSSIALQTVRAFSLPGGIDLSRVDLAVDRRVLAFAFAAATATVMVATIPSIRRISRMSVVAELARKSGRNTLTLGRVYSAILSLHVATTLTILTVAGLFITAVQRGLMSEPGFGTNRTVFASVLTRPMSIAYLSEAQRSARALAEAQALKGLLDSLRGRADIEMAALGLPPINPTNARADALPRHLLVDGKERDIVASFLRVGPEYYKALGVGLVAGRPLGAADIRATVPSGEQPVLITRALANALWPSQTPVGRRFSTSVRSSYVVVGVTGDFAVGSLRFSNRSAVLIPTDEVQAVRYLTLNFVMRSRPGHTGLGESVRVAVSEAFPNVGTVHVSTGTEVVEADLGQERLGAWFFAAFGCVALALSVGGVFGLVAYLTASRQHEMGLRVALGASANQVSWRVWTAGLWPVVLGAVAGTPLALFMARLSSVGLVGAFGMNWVVYVSAVVLLMATTSVAGLKAAWKLRTLSPISVLRLD